MHHDPAHRRGGLKLIEGGFSLGYCGQLGILLIQIGLGKSLQIQLLFPK